MFSNLFSGATLYIILALLASTAGFGYLSYSLYGDKAVAVAQLKYANNAILGYQKDAELKDLSCKIDDRDTVNLESEKNVLKDKVDELSAQISKLKSGIKKPVSQNTNNSEASKNAEAITILGGTELLSDDLKRMLTQSYCLVETCVAVPTGQPLN